MYLLFKIYHLKIIILINGYLFYLARDSLTSSWNSSEDEDSLSTGKKRALSPLGKSNVLNQIDEVNETLKSKNNSVLNQSKVYYLFII